MANDLQKIKKINTFDDLYNYMFLEDPETTKYYTFLLKDLGLIEEE